MLSYKLHHIQICCYAYREVDSIFVNVADYLEVLQVKSIPVGVLHCEVSILEVENY